MTKNGKKPLASKPKPTAIQDVDIFGNPLILEEELKAEIASKGQEFRWVDYKQLVDMGGYHKRGWRAYKRDKKEGADIVPTGEFLQGATPDGFFRRGSLILATRPISTGDRHRAANAKKAAAYQSFDKDKAKELKQMAGDADVSIHEGYEDNE